MAGMGPPPKDAAQRRRANAPMANTLKLPAEGRQGPPPEWPFPDDVPDVWGELWATPMAVAWESFGWTRMVARYCVVLTMAEVTMSTALLSEARQLEDRLGLSPMSLLRLRWEIVADEVTEKREEKTAATKKRRLKVVDADAVGS